MAECFHRNYLKATVIENFELPEVATNGAAKKICSELRQVRNQLLDILPNPMNETDVVLSALNNYLGLLHGFIASLDEEGGDSKLRHAIQFWWTSSLTYTCLCQSDAVYEEICMLFTVALWFMKHASTVAGKNEPTTDVALRVHKCLRVATGIFIYIKNELICQLKEQPIWRATDLDPSILDTYIHQCLAEAQEVGISRATELKQSSAIVSSLAHETAKRYQLADAALTSLGCLHWQAYLQSKAEIYYAYAYCYHGQTLLAQEKCGDAIKCLQESQSHYDQATKVVKKYSSGRGCSAKPLEHAFSLRLKSILQKTLEKCIYENNIIYLQPVPVVVPSLGEKLEFGIAIPEEFQMPPSNALWTIDSYRGFDETKLTPLKEMAISPEAVPPYNCVWKNPNPNPGCILS